MKKYFKLFAKILKAYSLEERVLSVIVLLVIVFIVTKNIVLYLSPQITFADKGILVEAMISDKPTILNPLFVDYSNSNREISSLIFSGLMKYDSAIGGFVNDLGELLISEDGKTYSFKLRDNVFWHDGEPLSIKDVIFTFRDVIQHESFSNIILKANFEGVKIEEKDSDTILFHLERPNSFFVTNLGVGILPYHVLKDVDVSQLVSNPYNFSPIGTGPFKVSSSLEFSDDGKQKVILEKNNEYYSKKPGIKEIRFKIFPNEDLLISDINTINIISRLPAMFSNIAKDIRFDVFEYTLPQYTAVFINTQNPIMKDKKMRIALIKSLDKKSLVNLLTDKTQIDSPFLRNVENKWIFEQNLDEAAGALFDLGYKYSRDDDGNIVEGQIYRKDKSGNDLALTLVAKSFPSGSLSQIDNEKTVDYLIDSYEKVGIRIDPVFLNDNDFSDALKQKNYHLLLAGQSLGYNLDAFPYWHSSQAKEGGYNFSNFKNLAVDQQIEKIRSTLDPIEKLQREDKLFELLADEIPAIILYRPKYYFASDSKVKGVVLQNLIYPSDRFSRIADWCIGSSCN